MNTSERQNRQYLQQGGVLVKLLVLVPLTVVLVVAGTIVFYQGRKVYWDYRVKAMCKKDGGIEVYQTMQIPYQRYVRLPKIGKSISIPPEGLAGSDTLVVSVETDTVLRARAPRVVRRERLVKEKVSGKILGRIVSYSRIGGDIPTMIGHPSYFSCPEYRELYAGQSRFFEIENKEVK